MFNIQDELKKLPDKPGVYIMKDENGNIIYIGKAVVLKNRVRQYFQNSANHSPKVKAMVEKISEFEYIVTDSELEALILECNLIKKHKPKFNILLKDDKNYPYIKVTMNEDYPRIFMTRRFEKDGARYFGPYSSAFAVKETIDFIKKLFPIKSCSKVFPRDIGKERPCLNYYINQCMGPCRGDVDKDEYRALMKDVCSFLSGKQEDAVKRLEEQMKAAAENMEFEKAARLRDKVKSIQHIGEKQKIVSTTMGDQDIIAVAKGSADSVIQVFFVRGGKLIGREHFVFEDTVDTENSEIIISFIKQFYSIAAFVPNEILIQENIEDVEVIENWLSEKRTSKVHIRAPKRGEKLHMVEMVMQNADLELNKYKEMKEKDESSLNEGINGMAELLGLPEPPKRIEAYDISNTGSSEIVASMVVFENGKPLNSEYRRFKIKTLDTQNDYASMQEVIFRRFKHAEKEKNENITEAAKFIRMPDVLFIDGGLGHVNAVTEVTKELNINIPVFGMVKNDQHRTRGLVTSQREYDLTDNMPVLRFVTSVQDEAHRFAIEYNRRLRGKRYQKSALDEIEGIGPKRKKALIKYFGSLSKIKTAEVDELIKVEGISSAVAKTLYDYFRQ